MADKHVETGGNDFPRRMSTALALAAALLATGCGGGDDGGNSADKGAVSFPYPAGLSAESSPSDVAGVLIEALDAKDKGTLLGLAAAKDAAKEVEAIFRKHGRSSEKSGKLGKLGKNAAAMVVMGWGATYKFCQAGKTTVKAESIQGNTAVVTAAAAAPDGKPKTIKIKLMREDGVWKVRAGIEG